MGRIPKYDQQRLASPAVGTPGVDTSRADMFSALGTEATKVQGALFDIAETQYRADQKELATRQAEQRAATKELEKLKRSSSIAERKARLGVEFTKQDNTLRESYRDDVRGITDHFKAYQDASIEAELDSITDPLEKVEAQREFFEMQGSYTTQQADWASAHEVTHILPNRVKNMAGLLKAQLNDPNLDDNQVTAKLRDFDKDNLEAYRAVHGEAAPTVMRDDKQAAVMQYLSGIAVRKPEEIEGYLAKYGGFMESLDATKRREFLVEVRRVAQQRKEEAALDAKQETLADNMSLSDRLNDLRIENGGVIPPHLLEQAISDHPKASPSLKISAGKSNTTAILSDRVKKQSEDEKNLQKTLKGNVVYDSRAVAVVIGNNAGRARKLHDTIENLIPKIQTPGTSSRDKARLIRELETNVSSFDESITIMRSAANSISDPSAKAAALAQIASIGELKSNVIGQLRKSPEAQKERALRADFRNSIKLTIPNDFARNGKAANAYSMFWKRDLEKEYQTLRNHPELLKNPKYIARLKKTLDQNARTAVMNLRLKGQ